MMDIAVTSAVQIIDAVAILILVSLGLAIIFGMMQVINLAHGEFIMLGGFATIFAMKAGVNIWVAMLLVSPLAVGVMGFVMERVVFRHLSGRINDTMLASWGLSLFLIGVTTMAFGNRVEGVAAPLGSFILVGYRVSVYNQVLVLVAVALVAGCYLFLTRTRAGMIARAAMQNPEMTASLGVNAGTVYAITFAAGAALAGMAGGLLAPISGVVPTMGSAYVIDAFVTVISGGGSVIAGTAASAALYGAISTVTTIFTTPVIGNAALLFAAIIYLRFRNSVSNPFKARQ
jgi:urea transport system permease protein